MKEKRAAQKKWASENKDKVRALHAEWRARNREKLRERHAKYCAEHPAERRASLSKWSKANREKSREALRKWREANREKCRTWGREYARATSDKRKAALAVSRGSRRAASRQARRSYYDRQASAPGEGLTSAQWREIVAMHNGRCAYCGRLAKLTLEHVEPLNKGGAHDESNVVAACKSCNSSKRDTSLLCWLIKQVA